MADRVNLEDFAAGGDLDGVTDDRDLDLAAACALGRPDSWPAKLTRCRMSRPCGSRSGRRSPAADVAAAASPCGSTPRLLGRAVPLGVSGDEHAAMMDRLTRPLATDTSTVSPSSHTPTGYDAAAKLILPVRPTRRVVVGSLDELDRLGRLGGGEAEPFPRHHVTDALMPSLVVVAVHPPIELLLGVGDRRRTLGRSRTRGAASCANARPCPSWSANAVR